jgi:hypothetical protein
MRFSDAVLHVADRLAAAAAAARIADGAARGGEPSLREYRAAPPPTPKGQRRPELREIGASGTTVFSGFLTGVEYNPDLQGSKGLDAMERMFRSDGTARGVERAVILPILSAQMSIEPASDDPRHVEIAEKTEDMLRRMSKSWQQTLLQILRYLRYGHYLFEMVWGVRDGMYVLTKLAPRPPKTIFRWYVDEHGDFAGVQQFVWVPDPQQSGFEKLATGKFAYIPIPPERCLLFVNEQEAGDFRGESIGRPMYKHWLLKEGIERISAIGVERREVGTEYAQVGKDATESDVDKIKAALASLHANQNGYLVMPEKDVVDGFGIFPQGQSRGTAQQLMEYHSAEMARSFLAEFLSRGSRTGSYAESRDKSSLFLLGIKSVADYVADTLTWGGESTPGPIELFVRLNFPGVTTDDIPRMRFSRLDTRKMLEYIQAVVAAIDAGALNADLPVRQAIRVELDLPEETERDEDALGDLLPDGADEELPENLLLTRQEETALREYAADPSRWEQIPGKQAVKDKTTGKVISGWAAAQIIKSIGGSTGGAAKAQKPKPIKLPKTPKGRTVKGRAPKPPKLRPVKPVAPRLAQAKRERDVLQRRLVDVPADQARQMLAAAGWTAAATAFTDAQQAVEAAAQQAQANPEEIVSVVNVRGQFMVISKGEDGAEAATGDEPPANAGDAGTVRGDGDGARRLSQGEEDDESFDSGVPDAETLRRYEEAGERLAPFFGGAGDDDEFDDELPDDEDAD